jgi:hypothetical protein
MPKVGCNLFTRSFKPESLAGGKRVSHPAGAISAHHQQRFEPYKKVRPTAGGSGVRNHARYLLVVAV